MSVGGDRAAAGANPLFSAGQAVGSGIGNVARTALSPVSGLASGLGITGGAGGGGAGAIGPLMTLAQSLIQQGAPPGQAAAQQRPGTPGPMMSGMTGAAPQAGGLTGGIMSGAPIGNTAVPGNPGAGQGPGSLNLNDPQTMMRIRQMIQAGLLG